MEKLQGSAGEMIITYSHCLKKSYLLIEWRNVSMTFVGPFFSSCGFAKIVLPSDAK